MQLPEIAREGRIYHITYYVLPFPGGPTRIKRCFPIESNSKKKDTLEKVSL
jgi:hypothetical protein